MRLILSNLRGVSLGRKVNDMSLWTHVVGAIHANFYAESTEEAWDNALLILKDAPKVTGSEGDMQTFVHPLDGYNNSEYNNGEDRQWQTCMVVSLVGDLRDRTIEQTNQELKAFLDYVKDSPCFMRGLSVTVTDNFATYTYVNPDELGTPLDDEDY